MYLVHATTQKGEVSMLAPHLGYSKNTKREKTVRKHRDEQKKENQYTRIDSNVVPLKKKTNEFCYTCYVTTDRGFRCRYRIRCAEDALDFLEEPGLMPEASRRALMHYMVQNAPQQCEYLFALAGLDIPKSIERELEKRLPRIDA